MDFSAVVLYISIDDYEKQIEITGEMCRTKRENEHVVMKYTVCTLRISVGRRVHFLFWLHKTIAAVSVVAVN